MLPLIGGLRGYDELVQLIRSSSTERPKSLPLAVLEEARPYLLAGLRRDLSLPMLVVTPRRDRAREIHEQLRIWSPSSVGIFPFPEPDVLIYERIPWDRGMAQDRLATLTSLVRNQGAPDSAPTFVVASVRALLHKTVPRERFVASMKRLEVGQLTSIAEILSTLHGLGYERTVVVEEPGSFSARGGIVDVFPPQNEQPVRIEFFGDEIESLRHFDPTTQRSVQTTQSLVIAPAREAFPLGADRQQGAEQLDLTSCIPEVAGEFQQDLEALSNGQVFDTLEFYLPYLYDKPGMLVDYMPPDTLLVLEDPLGLEAMATTLEVQNVGLRQELTQKGELPQGVLSPHFTWSNLQQGFDEHPRLEFRYDVATELAVSEGFVAGTHYGGRLQDVIADSLEMMDKRWRVTVVSRQTPRLAELYEDWEVVASPVEEIASPPPEGSLTLLQGSLASGWQMRQTDGGRTILLTDGEIFGWLKPEPRRPHRPKPLPPESFFSDIAPGDYVVHIEHGIGTFRGLVRLDVQQAQREYLQVDYAAGDRLYVPTYQGDRISRYVGVKAQPPRVDRLGTAHWSRVKASTRRAVEEMAKELLGLYSTREVVQGHAFAPDTPWQTELDASFPYIETEDQMRAIDEVKRDMENPRPMDRLVCGDVGYGKTEVAVRAAFKAVMDNKQVTLLVPTTVLAQQHYRTFKERLAPFPVEVEMLSRFRTHSEQERILERLRKGTVDIVIGTHRLLQKDVAFKDLGLLIIDEEQRFGVAHKEQLKQMRREVDVLTLTATPIPRTLYLSLAGARDMNTIDTPPEYRLPVVTRVAAYDEGLIRRAILRELDRGGQVYFVHNRVRGIRQIANRLSKIVPEADTAVAHGQMEEATLAQVMTDFAAGAHDILVCTSIIESGIDIPNANTLIINRADRFGLAQLYQLRGRVGRSTVRAYAYLLYDEGAPLSDEARKRLQTIKEASELGAGFRIAMRDLEIRGGGDVLGTRQHGHISAVGFDLYCRLLAKAIQDLKEREGAADEEKQRPPRLTTPEPAGPTIGLPLDAHLPEEYVQEDALRLGIYRRMAGLQTLEQVDRMRQELKDRFGALPKEAENLIYLLRLKVLATQAGVETVSTERDRITIGLGSLAEVKRRRSEGRLPTGLKPEDDKLLLPSSLGHKHWQRLLEKALRDLAQ
ncbi:MAG: transcription-repair coupling factor [Chloroflexi bacterium B3_Chlor]|nr:MAG: transcription-repair coupling factor [Chloroflexi bacterium B3_Chlor]